MISSSKYDYAVHDLLGKPITIAEWVKLTKNPWSKENYVGPNRVLTIWTGVDAPDYDPNNERMTKTSRVPEIPMIYVTYAWNADLRITHSKRYKSMHDAELGHARVLELLSKSLALVTV